MRILILSILLILTSCGVNPKLPEFPDIKDHWLVEVRDQEVPDQLLLAITNRQEIPEIQYNQEARCLKFEIVNRIPYKIKFVDERPMRECHLVGGYKPDDAVSLYNWLIDAKDYIEKFKHCFK